MLKLIWKHWNALAKKFHVWSFWDEKYLGMGRQAIENQSIPSHGNLTLKITSATEDSNEILLVGSTLHISMGAAEVESFATTDTTVNIILNEGVQSLDAFICTVYAQLDL